MFASIGAKPAFASALEAQDWEAAEVLASSPQDVLMLETESGIAPPSWQHGIGDTYIYKCPGAEEGMGNLEHLHMDELGFIWEFINGELGCGEHVSNASAAKYRSQLARYRIRNQRER